MPRESRQAKAVRAGQIIDALERAIPEAKIALDYSDHLQLLTAVMLSAQATDAMVNTATPALFARFPTAQSYADSSPEEIEPYIRRIGLYRNKAKNLHAAMTILAGRNGEIPRTREELCELPGVGWKTAGVVINHAFGTPAFPVDTHITRVSRRLGLAKAKQPDQIEAELSALLPKERWGRGHQLLIWHGRRTCAAPTPRCSSCCLSNLCPRVEVSRSR